MALSQSELDRCIPIGIDLGFRDLIEIGDLTQNSVSLSLHW